MLATCPSRTVFLKVVRTAPLGTLRKCKAYPPTAPLHFLNAHMACSVLQSGVAAIFGPASDVSAAHVQAICDALEIPHIETRWEYRLTRDPYSVNLYPHPSSLSRAYVDVLRAQGWSKLTLIYETMDGLVRVQEVLKDPHFRITLRQLPHSLDFRPLLKDIKKSGSTHLLLDVRITRLPSVLKQAQQIGLMTSYHHYFITTLVSTLLHHHPGEYTTSSPPPIITSSPPWRSPSLYLMASTSKHNTEGQEQSLGAAPLLDLHTVELEDFKYGGTNITALRLIDPSHPDLRQLVASWGPHPDQSPPEGRTADRTADPGLLTRFPDRLPSDIYGLDAGVQGVPSHHTEVPQPPSEPPSTAGVTVSPPRETDINLTLLPTEVALIYDAVQLFAKALEGLDRSIHLNVTRLRCDEDVTWHHGNSLVNYMKWVSGGQ
ncbi:Receptor ligand binding region [Trinorchestia longiramus]|nr:Receptor ligand binding region [Trinorchestia longiramus]